MDKQLDASPSASISALFHFSHQVCVHSLVSSVLPYVLKCHGPVPSSSSSSSSSVFTRHLSSQSCFVSSLYVCMYYLKCVRSLYEGLILVVWESDFKLTPCFPNYTPLIY
ncbi:hypothetical protein ILYODFUR_018686 [Ilyodon furcidens]|uniref:Uncharacterized protein n=1 Tax=Ilyodon furcidens TaxID=33524 RepID=A0ABV0VF49_9TELE